MRILWYWPFVRPEEIDWARAIADRGHQLAVQVVDREAAPEPGTWGNLSVRRDLPDVDRSVGRVAWPLSRARTYLERARRRRTLVVGQDWDLVHFHYPNRFTDAWIRPSTLWVLSVHDVHPHAPRLGVLERRVLARLYDRPDGLVVHHEWIRDALIDEFDVQPDRICVVPHQVFPVDGPSERSTDDDRPMVLFFGALRANKGLDVLIDAVRRLPTSEIRLHIAGRGDAPVERQALAAAADLPNVTAEIGYVTTDRKDELFRSSAVVALPYRSFTSQSGVLHDAYGHWRPVVVTDVGALGPTVRTDQTGLVVPAGSPKELAEALTELIGPGGVQYSAFARDVALQRSPQATALATLDAYEHFRRRS